MLCDKKLEKPKDYLQHRFVYEVFKGQIPKCKQVDHQNNDKLDNRIKNLQLLTPQENCEKSNGKPVISTNISSGKERRFNSIQASAIELDINAGSISSICCNNKNKTSTSKKDTNVQCWPQDPYFPFSSLVPHFSEVWKCGKV